MKNADVFHIQSILENDNQKVLQMCAAGFLLLFLLTSFGVFFSCVRFQMDFVQEVLFFAFSSFSNEKLLHCSASHSLGEYVNIEVSNFRLNLDCCGITVKKIHISFILTFIFV